MATGLGAVITSHPFQRSYTQQPHRSSQHLPRALIQVHFCPRLFQVLLLFHNNHVPCALNCMCEPECECHDPRLQRDLDNIRICTEEECNVPRMRVLCERGCVDFRGWRQGHEVWVFPSNGGKSDMCVLGVWACITFEGLHSVPVECVVADTIEKPEYNVRKQETENKPTV
jgi:hypothetical protein